VIPYRPGVAQRVGRGIALIFHDQGTRRGVSGQQHAPAALYPQERPGTHFTVGWVGSRAGLDGRKISSPPGFDPGPSRLWLLFNIKLSAFFLTNLHLVTFFYHEQELNR